MAEKSLAVNVTVGAETYEAGTTPPKEIAEQITNPKAWGTPDSDGDSEPEKPEPKVAPAKKTAAKRSSSK